MAFRAAFAKHIYLVSTPAIFACGTYVAHRRNDAILEQLEATPEMKYYHRARALNRATTNGLLAWIAMSPYVPASVAIVGVPSWTIINVYTQTNVIAARRLAGEQYNGDALAAWNNANVSNDVWP
jgi:hypothetical protein